MYIMTFFQNHFNHIIKLPFSPLKKEQTSRSPVFNFFTLALSITILIRAKNYLQNPSQRYMLMFPYSYNIQPKKRKDKRVTFCTRKMVAQNASTQTRLHSNLLNCLKFFQSCLEIPSKLGVLYPLACLENFINKYISQKTLVLRQVQHRGELLKKWHKHIFACQNLRSFKIIRTQYFSSQLKITYFSQSSKCI